MSRPLLVRWRGFEIECPSVKAAVEVAWALAEDGEELEVNGTGAQVFPLHAAPGAPPLELQGLKKRRVYRDLPDQEEAAMARVEAARKAKAAVKPGACGVLFEEETGFRTCVLMKGHKDPCPSKGRRSELPPG